MYDVYFRGDEAVYHCDESWKKKVSGFPQIGHRVYLKIGPGKYANFRVVDIEWNTSDLVFIDLEKESSQ